MPQPEDRPRAPADQTGESSAIAKKFQSLHKRANNLRLTDPTLRIRAGIPEATFRRYTAGRYGNAEKFERHLLALAEVVDAEERRLRAILNEPKRQ